MEFTGILRLTQYGIYIQISSIVLFVAVLFSPKSRVIPPDKRQEVTDYIVRFINNNTYLESNNNISDKCTTSSAEIATKYEIFQTTNTSVIDANAEGVEYDDIFERWDYNLALSDTSIFQKKDSVGKISHIKNDPWQLALYVCFESNDLKKYPDGLCGCILTCGGSLIHSKWAITEKFKKYPKKVVFYL